VRPNEATAKTDSQQEHPEGDKENQPATHNPHSWREFNSTKAVVFQIAALAPQQYELNLTHRYRTIS
jgi:hypothetical protein